MPIILALLDVHGILQTEDVRIQTDHLVPCKFLIYCLGILIFSSCFAQIKFDAKVSDKHLNKVEKSKDARAKLKSYKKFYSKDSIKAARQAWKDYRKNNKDSLKAEGKWKDIKAHRREVLLGKYNQNSGRYFVDPELFSPPQDSMDWAMQELAKSGDFQSIQKVYEAYGQYDSAYLDRFKLDSMQLDSGMLAERFAVKERLESYLPPELAQSSNQKIEQQMMHGQLDQFGQIQQIDRSGVKDFFENISPEEFAKSQVSLNAAKEKYASLANLSNEEEGVKRNSLKGTPLKNRFFLNGNIAIQSTDPVILDSNIQLGYQWTKKLSTGIGLMIREQVNNRDSTSITGDAHGISTFVNYDILKGFFLYGEYQRVKNKSLFSESTLPNKWETAMLVGAGRKFTIAKKVSLSVMLLFDLNYKSNTLNRRPLVPRIGYMVNF
ncbi:hypothetical protein [Ekhidna sp. To15]|uniref:hypothetical protein n=1 Tax=Ekhidna sp. To15 TaxID=3395267 RepID=UPI003F51DBA6